MDNWEQYNNEQYGMLRFAVNDTSVGICLFRADSPVFQIDIARRLKQETQKKSYILNMAMVSHDLMPDSAVKMRKLLEGHEECKVIIICNLQLCGIELGDEDYIRRLNYMRDQLLSMNKVWVLGMQNYFAVLMSRHAIDLYSCIMNHFDFKSYEEVSIMELKMDDFTGNIKIEMDRFMTLRKGIEKRGVENVSINELFELITTWNGIYKYCTEETALFVGKVCKRINISMPHSDINARECERYHILAIAYSHLGDYGTSFEIMSLIKKNFKKIARKHNEQDFMFEYLYGNIYIEAGKYADAIRTFNRLISYYVGINLCFYEKYRASDKLAWAYACTGNYDKAVDIYTQTCMLIDENAAVECDKAFLWNNKGACLLAKRDYSNALKSFLKADALINKKAFIGMHARVNVLKNIGYTYKLLGDYNKGIDFLTRAKNLLTQTDEDIFKTDKMKFIDYAIKECKDNLMGLVTEI